MPARKKISPVRVSKDQANKSAENIVSQNASARARRDNIASAATFAAEFSRQMKQHGDNHRTLLRAIAKPREGHAHMLFAHWARGKTTPRWPSSFELLGRIERHYHLPKGHFLRLIQPDSPMRAALKSVSLNQQHIMRWHLPDDFDSRSPKERETILTWAHQNVLTGATDFGKFLQRTSKKRYGIRFSELGDVQLRKKSIARYAVNGGLSDNDIGDQDLSAADEAPPRLIAELDSLVRFKRATIALPGFRRYTSWSKYTAELRAQTYGRLFGALSASPRSSIGGLGVSKSKLTLALMVFPAVWDWYLGWRESRRGFFTKYEVNTLVDVMSLTRRGTGWIRQTPELAENLAPIAGLLTRQDVRKAKRDWQATCDMIFEYLRSRVRELRRINRNHRDPFEAIISVLKTESPLAEYRKITLEILRQMPDETLKPIETAESVRAYLMLRFGMHLGLRQRNFRELLLCPRGQEPKGSLTLQERRCGEIRWCDRDNGWEVFIPALAFKNWDSTFFRKGAFRLVLPDLENLYSHIDAYIGRHRISLLAGNADPGTFFVRTMKSDKKSGAYDTSGFYFAWRSAIQRYGIYNPYTGRGAIRGLLPHGPHAVRDVLATHVIKHTASYELAGFAVHDTADVVRNHYCRFLPEEKTALAAKILNKVWQSN